MSMYDLEMPIKELFADFVIPDWIDQEISPARVEAIIRGGCASGAYMPAVIYHQAAQTMSEHGDEVLEFIRNSAVSSPTISPDDSWSMMAVKFLSMAVELWALSVEDELRTSVDKVSTGL